MTWLWTILGGVALGLLTNELFDWIGWLAERLLQRAARHLPNAFQQRYLAEWLGDLDTVPGKLGKLAWALKRLAEAPDLGQELGTLPRGRNLLAIRRGIDLLVASAGLVVSGPLLLTAALAIRLTAGPGPILTRQPHLRPDGEQVLLLGFRTLTTEAPTGPTAVGRVLEGLHLGKLPMLLNVLRGDLSLLGRRPEQPSPTRANPAHIPAIDAEHARATALVEHALTTALELAYLLRSTDLQHTDLSSRNVLITGPRPSVESAHILAESLRPMLVPLAAGQALIETASLLLPDVPGDLDDDVDDDEVHQDPDR
jgi:hypothetical protein